MNLFGQLLAIAATNLRNIPLRLGSSLVIVIGIAGVVGVLIPIVATALAFKSATTSDGRPDRAIVLTHVAQAEYESNLTREEVAQFVNAPQVRRDARGESLGSGELVLSAPVSRKSDHADVDVTLRGVSKQYFAVRPELKLVAGRMYASGTHELLAGAAAVAEFDGLEIGSRINLRDGEWTIVGIFAGSSGSRESELIADAETMMSAYELGAFNTLTVQLNDVAGFESFRELVVRDSKSRIDVRTEPEYLAAASGDMNRMLHIVVYAIGSIMALGALFSALNSMYSVVAARAAEMATLRAIGFSAAVVALGVLIEALVLALIGALIGGAISYALFNGAAISTLGGAHFDAQLVYSLTISPTLLLSVVLLACALGLAGGLVPAIRAARSNIADTLHET